MTTGLIRIGLLLSLMIGMVSPACGQTAILHIPVPADVTAFVEAQGLSLPPHLDIEVIDNGSPFLRHPDERLRQISLTASGLEQSGHIYLSVKTAVHLPEPATRAILVHELVHVAQEQSGRRFLCDGQREAEAYQVQNMYLDAQGLPPALDEQSLAALQHCTRGVRADAN